MTLVTSHTEPAAPAVESAEFELADVLSGRITWDEYYADATD